MHDCDKKYGPGVVKIIGVGFEPEAYAGFREGGYFEGKIYLANKEELYRTAGYKRLGCLQCWGFCGLCCTKKACKYICRGRKDKIKWNVKGDGYQMGGVMLIRNDGTLLLNHAQTGFTDIPEIEELSKIIDKNIVDKRERVERIDSEHHELKIEKSNRETL